jgi:hypothetical protein
MKKVLLFLVPFLIAILIFFSILFFLDRKTGKGALQVTSVPKSNVYLNDKLVGITPFCACDLKQMLSVGDYAIKLVPAEGGNGSFEEKISINKSTLTVVDRTFANNGSSEGSIINLIPLNDKKDIQISVVSLPDSANVFLDSNPVGITPLLLKQVGESDHDIRITKDGYKDKSLKIKTTSGFKLTSFVFLGINADLSVSQTALSSSLPTATSSASILILNTPTGFLRVREGNSINSSEITRVTPGESFKLISEKEGWFEIKLTDGKTGWVSSLYAAKE